MNTEKLCRLPGAATATGSISWSQEGKHVPRKKERYCAFLFRQELKSTY